MTVAAPVSSKRNSALDDIPFGRNRLLATIGAAAVGLAGRSITPEVASAYHGPEPPGCYGYGECHCCSGCTCCSEGCENWGDVGCHTNLQCWFTCIGTTLYKCCDWKSPAGPQIFCICRCNQGQAEECA